MGPDSALIRPQQQFRRCRSSSEGVVRLRSPSQGFGGGNVCWPGAMDAALQAWIIALIRSEPCLSCEGENLLESSR